MENKMEKLMKLLKNDPAFEKEFTDLLKARDFKAVIRLAGEHEIELEEADFAPIETREMDSNELENVAAGIKSSCTTSVEKHLCMLGLGISYLGG